MEIVADDLNGPEIAELLRTHLRDMALSSPPESVHALDLEALRKPEVTFWSVWQDGQLSAKDGSTAKHCRQRANDADGGIGGSWFMRRMRPSRSAGTTPRRSPCERAR